MSNLALNRKDDVSSFRKIAIGTWREAYDPQVYGTLTVRMDEALRYVSAFRERTGRRLTISHLMAKAVAMALAECPEANAILRFNRIYLRETIGVFFQVVMTDEGLGKVDLSGATLYEVDKKSLVQICDEFEQKVQKVRDRKDEALEKTRSTFLSIPYLFLNLALKLISFFSYTLNLDLRRLGIPKDPFGSAMVTNVGSLGLDVAYVPVVPYSRVPLLLAIGAVKEAAVVEGGQIQIAKVMTINATFDHRIIDGFHASVMSRVLREWLEHPFQHFDPLEATATLDGPAVPPEHGVGEDAGAPARN
ncbi:MAG TPA: 2-oxo acid dehydrogenase subunit E2 [Myxococcales bacterium]|jgi:pyruvate dehydrogenase E2 component (dihydrolipoamide acetyltransferase)